MKTMNYMEIAMVLLLGIEPRSDAYKASASNR